MDLESALQLLDALDNNGDMVDNVVTVEPVIDIPLNEIGKRLDENENIAKDCFQEGLLGESSSVSDNIVPENIEVIADNSMDDIVIADTSMDDIDISIQTEQGTDINDQSLSLTENDDTDKKYTPNSSTHTSDEETEIDTAQEEKEEKRSRKRKRKISQWKREVRKRRRQSGDEYTSQKGKKMRKREVTDKKDCMGNCKFKCAAIITKSERECFFKEFWNLCDTEKNTFYEKTTERKEKERKRTSRATSRRNYSYSFFFVKGDEKVRVCKTFYLSTLDVSQRRIQWYYERKQTSFADERGKYAKPQIDPAVCQSIKNHINSFPRMPSHYARKNTSKEFLESDLNLATMYKMYVEKCAENKEEPCKEHMYRHVFNYEFNVDFFKPKKDLCDICQEYEAQKNANMINGELREKYSKHLLDKEATRIERSEDRSKSDKAVICFDLQNVLTCPRANVSNFFYKRKLSVFNLTAHFSLTKEAYNAVWCEGTAGRGGNEIASALVAILHQISQKHGDITDFTLWSDSCVAQNRNSLMTTALKRFLVDHPNVTSITQKFCTPGHSSVQEVDNIHSHLEKALKLSEIYSPVSLLRVLKKVRPEKSVVMQLQDRNFMDFKKASGSLKCSSIPFSKLKYSKIDSDKPFVVEYKTSFTGEVQEGSIRSLRCQRSSVNFPSVSKISKRPTIAKEKKENLRSMFKFMPLVDRQYYEALFRGTKPVSSSSKGCTKTQKSKKSKT